MILTICLALGVVGSDGADSDGAWLDREIGGLVEFYKVLHSHPELSFHEVETA
jgi:hypothetical protein